MITTPRLIIKKAVFDDWKDMFHNLWKHEESARYMMWSPIKTGEEARVRMLQVIDHQSYADTWCVYDKMTKKAIGFCGIKRSAEKEYTETGIAVGPLYTGQGLGREIVRALIDYVFGQLGGESMIYECRVDNLPSNHLAQASGFHFLKKKDIYCKKDNVTYSVNVYILYRNEDSYWKEQPMKKEFVSGIAVCNPYIVEKEYLKKTIDYAIREGNNHVQIIGPIHDYIRGNIGGMINYEKYAEFNGVNDQEFIKNTKEAFAEVLPAAKKAGIKLYVWHHELDLPDDFGEKYPETLNSDKDYEVTHPLIRDFLEHRLMDFFHQYPMIDGIVLTLHETKVPLLKLKNQKLGRTERVKYITEILYKTCVSLGKELIVRPFASIPEDYMMMMDAYAEISTDLPVMDKWTQFDWSLCLPSNKFFKEIKKNPLLVETDIFGEYFGKGRLPLMLLEHIKEKVSYCSSFPIIGYASRIDRNGMDPFDTVNEVNLDIMTAMTHKEDPSEAANKFFEKMYPGVGKEIREIMDPTEEILRKTFWLKGYYFSELSYFPALNHSRNHFYFEMMKKEYHITSGEWFIPKDWNRGTIESIREEKEEAIRLAREQLAKLEKLEGKIEKKKYADLHERFLNFRLVTEVWRQLAEAFIRYVAYFETGDIKEKEAMEQALEALLAKRAEGEKLLGNRFYCFRFDNDTYKDFIGIYVKDMRNMMKVEEETLAQLKAKNPIDYLVCAGGTEGHKLKKEVNFSDTTITGDGKLYRVPGALRDWSRVNAHGWFSYEMKVDPNKKCRICFKAGSLTKDLHIKVTVGEDVTEFHETIGDVPKEFEIIHKPNGKEIEVVRFDRLTGDTPCLYTVYTL